MIKLDLKLPEYILEIFQIFKDNNYPVYLVGGSIRDLLLNKEVKDYDFTTPIGFEKFKTIFKGCSFVRPNGAKHGTYTLRYKKHNIEITTFKHDDNEEKSLEVDSYHRDITINSLMYDGEYLYDFRHGLDDLNNHIVSMGDNPLKIINEDPLRMLRAIRIMGELNFEIDENTKKTILENYELLNEVAKERIISEVLRILLVDKVEEILLTYQDLFAFLFLPLKPTLNFDQNNRWHPHDLYNHTVHVVKNTMKDKNARFAALLHDIGKVETVSQEYIEGVGYINHYYGHPAKSGELAKPLLNEYRFSNFDKDEILFLIINHDNKISLTTKSVKKVLAKIYNFNNDNPLDTLRKLLTIQLSDHLDHTWFTPIEIDETLKIAKTIIEERDAFTLKDLAINGTDLNKLGYEGKEIGDILKTLLNLVIEEDIKNNKEDLLNYVKEHYPLR